MIQNDHLLKARHGETPQEWPIGSFTYHAVGYYYLKYSWEYFMQKIYITYSFIVDNPNILGSFLLCVGQGLGENYLTHI